MPVYKNILEEIKKSAARRDAIEKERNAWLAVHTEEECFRQQAEWAKNDLWYLCYYVLGWHFYDCDYAKFFCEKVQENPDQLWLVARGHLKSLTITCASTIQFLINAPNKSVGLMSYNSQSAKTFLRQIKNILETNEGLKKYYPDIFYEKPQTQSTLWSESAGLNIKRTTTRKEPSLFAFGLVDSQQTGMHADLLLYDDVVIQDSVGTPYMINKTTRAWELSSNLGMMTSKTQTRYCGTRYHYYDTYATMIERGIPFTIIPATHDGTMEGKPIFMSEETLAQKIMEQGTYTFSAQMLLNPVPEGSTKLNPEDIQYYDDPEDVPLIRNVYLVCDPANEGSKQSDYTTMLALGYDEVGDLWLIDGIHDKVGLGRRWNLVCDLSKANGVCMVGYEKYGMQSDLEYFDMELKRGNGRCPGIKVLGGVQNKRDRILRITPLLEQRRIHFPRSLKKISYFDNREYDLTQVLVQEITDFPFGKHDDAIDALSRIFDIVPVMPHVDHRTEEERFWDSMKQEKKQRSISFLRKPGAKIGRWHK